MSNSLMSTYGRFPIRIVKGKGCAVWDENGNQYLDFTAGIATCNLGHVPDLVKDKLSDQLDTLWHCSNLYHIPNQEALADQLAALSTLDKVFFCNSGAEANEAAIKLARRYARKIKGNKAYEVVTFVQSFHGRTMATLSATGQKKIQEGYEPLVDGFRTLPYNDFDALEELIGEKTCAVLLELVQGEGGVIPADKDWVSALAKRCSETDVLLMIDEIQTGIGRTGTLFAYEQYGIAPDVVTLAKGLASGFPIGAMLAKADVAEAFDPGAHGSTFGGNPLATTAGTATLKAIVDQEILSNCKENGAYFKQHLERIQKAYPDQIVSVRGLGLMLGIETKTEAINVVNALRNQGVLVLTAGPHVVRILPPLIVQQEDIDRFIEKLFTVIKAM
ncbi:acetylornithine transaminase [Camelliibacillus cellulosilyticus]|uniref:Acetylornithine aminotransferase n=1 Tax=Camelliibacillus cellulosilyticus TaxID=2174486 RepID=A0ABV9GIH9_9BACL